jgi:adenylate cyclase
MAIEIERKFLVRNGSWRARADAGTRFRQGYFTTPRRASIRVRIEGEHANINIKSAELGVRRLEFEYPVPLEEAEQMLEQLCEQPQVEKTRYHVQHAGQTWEIDVFEGDNTGLVVAEIELESEDAEFARPDWLGEEVSDDPRYYNVSLVTHPYKDW